MPIRLLADTIYAFYRYDCCWPYTVSFFLVLVIYWMDFFIVHTRDHWVSLVAYGVIFAYYLYNIRLYSKGELRARNTKFFAQFLSFKIIIWGLILGLLCLVS